MDENIGHTAPEARSDETSNGESDIGGELIETGERLPPDTQHTHEDTSAGLGVDLDVGSNSHADLIERIPEETELESSLSDEKNADADFVGSDPLAVAEVDSVGELAESESASQSLDNGDVDPGDELNLDGDLDFGAGGRR